MSILNKRVMILNSNWEPIRIKNVKNAIILVSRERADFIDGDNYDVYNWNEWIKLEVSEQEDYIMSTRGKIKVPRVVRLRVYGKIPLISPRLTKRNVFMRDNSICQYSGEKVTTKTGDIDHIKPISKGGKNEWGNVVVCSKNINRKKGNKTLEEAGLRLIKKPTKPTYRDILIDSSVKFDNYWSNFIKK